MEENKQELVTTEENGTKVALRSQEGLLAVAQTYLKKNGDVILPQNYDVNDAIKALYLKTLQTVDKQKRPVLDVCSKESIEQVVQNYVSKGLNIAKNQCYIVAYGNTLTLQDSYFGKEKQARAYAGVTIRSNVIYEGEDVKIVVRNDGTKIIEHKPDFTKFNIDKIVGAYAVAVREDGSVDDSEIMTMQEIKKSWAKSQSGMTVHKEFPVEMCRKTVIGRLAKRYINTSDDSAKFEVLNSDMGEYDYSSIDADTVIIEDNKPTPKPTVKPSQEDAGVEMVFDDIDGEKNTKEIFYSEFKDHKDKYTAVPNSYDKEKKTILVYC